MRRRKCLITSTQRRVANSDIRRYRLLENTTTVNCWWENNIISSCEQSRKASSSTVVGAAENRGTGLTTRLSEVITGTIRPQPSELWHGKPHPQQTRGMNTNVTSMNDESSIKALRKRYIKASYFYFDVSFGRINIFQYYVFKINLPEQTRQLLFILVVPEQRKTLNDWPLYRNDIASCCSNGSRQTASPQPHRLLYYGSPFVHSWLQYFDTVGWASARAELSMGPFCVTQSNPTHQLTDTTNYKWKNLDPTRPNPIQLTIELTV